MFMSGYDRKNVFKNIVLYLCVSALFILPISTLLTSLPAFAAGYFDGLSIQEKYKFYVYARVIDKCLSKWPGYHPNVHNGNIFSSGKVYVGTFPEFTGQGYNESEGSFDCSSKELLSEAVNKFGIKPVERATAAETLFCYMGYKRASQTTGPNEKKVLMITYRKVILVQVAQEKSFTTQMDIKKEKYLNYYLQYQDIKKAQRTPIRV